MLNLLLGPDSFSKQEFISSLAAKEKAEVEFFINGDEAPNLRGLLGQDLFAKKRILVLKGLVGKYEWNDEIISRLASSMHKILIEEEKLDKRIVSSKLLLGNKQVMVKEFALPHGSELDSWLLARFNGVGVKISATVVSFLAKKIGRDNAVETKFGGKVVDVKEVYTLWQADQEVKKLAAYANGEPVSEDDVEQLVVSNTEVDVFQIINAIADNSKLLALRHVSDFLGTAGDDKSRIIQLNALLSDQFRSIVIVQDFVSRMVEESIILEKTGWKSGRLFMLKKIALRFTLAKAKDFLNKLDHLDDELKSSSTPPRVLLDLILAQLLM